METPMTAMLMTDAAAVAILVGMEAIATKTSAVQVPIALTTDPHQT
jgi:hypothetical protein